MTDSGVLYFPEERELSSSREPPSQPLYTGEVHETKALSWGEGGGDRWSWQWPYTLPKIVLELSPPS